MRIIDLEPGPGQGPRQWGQKHGESFRGEIRSIAALRIHLTIKLGGFTGEEEVLEVAAAHLPVLERYDRALYDELVGIAEGAATSPAHIVVVNHYTDLRDIKRASAPASPAVDAGGCSVLWARGTREAHGAHATPRPILAQTWDMHASAIPYVALLRVPASEAGGRFSPSARPGALLLTLTGCLGMCGVNQHGVAIAINNLASTDARVGIVWPALVRRALAEKSAAGARDVVLDAPLGSGHHYFVADRSAAYGIETSGTRRKVMFAVDDVADPASPESYIHTNHCLDSDIAERSQVAQASTTHERFDWLEASVASKPVSSIADAWARLGSDEGYPRSVCTNMATPEAPHAPATCGAIAVALGEPTLWAQAGLIHNVAPERYDLVPSGKDAP